MRNTAISDFVFVFYPIKQIVLINLKFATVAWIFNMTKFMWVIFRCFCVDPLGLYANHIYIYSLRIQTH